MKLPPCVVALRSGTARLTPAHLRVQYRGWDPVSVALYRLDPGIVLVDIKHYIVYPRGPEVESAGNSAGGQAVSSWNVSLPAKCWQSCVVTPNEGKKLRSVRMRSRETRRHASSEWVLLRATCKSSRAHTRRARKQAPRPHVLPIPPHLECPQGVQPCTFRPHIPCVGVKAPRPGSKTGRSSQLAVFD